MRVLSKKIGLVVGDFRQDQVIDQWEKIGSDHCIRREVYLSELTLVTSRRFYARSFVQNLSKKLAIPATVYSLRRTQNGPFVLSQELTTVDVQDLAGNKTGLRTG